jgi:hypothetical protein
VVGAFWACGFVVDVGGLAESSARDSSGTGVRRECGGAVGGAVGVGTFAGVVPGDDVGKGDSD